MCVGALILSRIKKIYFGAKDIKAGGCGSVFNIASDNRLNHKIEVSSGLLEEECARIIKEFFQNRR
jgi:tRNA(adenine34) deaminase